MTAPIVGPRSRMPLDSAILAALGPSLGSTKTRRCSYLPGAGDLWERGAERAVRNPPISETGDDRG